MFLKWAGGKRRLLNFILPHIPKKFGTYFEPFLGGGAVFFTLPPDAKTVLGDVNEELVACYAAARDNPEGVLKVLRGMAKEQAVDEKYYYTVRNADRSMDFFTASAEYKAARFIFINRLGFNGLWRVNSKNQCNVPFGHRKFSFDEQAFFETSKRLATADLACRDFAETVAPAKGGGFRLL